MKNRIRVRTLIIDDDSAICRRISGWLGGQAHEVSAFTDARAAVEHVAGARCELALVDLRLPDADGSEIIAQLREVSPDTRVVAMTAFPKPVEVRDAIRAGAREVLEKPIQKSSLFRALDRQLVEIGIPASTELQFNQRLGARIRGHRRNSGRTQKSVAEEAGITPAQLSQIEWGKTGTSAWTLARIGSAMKLPLESLFQGL